MIENYHYYFITTIYYYYYYCRRISSNVFVHIRSHMIATVHPVDESIKDQERQHPKEEQEAW